MYHITITSTSDKYTIGNPRQIRDETTGLLVTDPGTDNAELVSPSFMIASSLGGFMLGAGNLTLDNSANSLRLPVNTAPTMWKLRMMEQFMTIGVCRQGRNWRLS